MASAEETPEETRVLLFSEVLEYMQDNPNARTCHKARNGLEVRAWRESGELKFSRSWD